MKHLLIDLINTSEPSEDTINLCLALLRPEYASVPVDDLHRASLLEGRNAALNTARALEGALRTERQGHLDHADLLGRLNQLQQVWATQPGMFAPREQLKDLLLQHETTRTLRALRKS